MTDPDSVVVLCPPADPDELVYPDHVRFYDEFLSLIYPQDPDGTPRWCPSWRAHPAADYAVMALWRAWEKLQQDTGPGQASWLANLAGPIMRDLTADPGPFTGCRADRHNPQTAALPRTGC